ncbi:MAG: hypothetical protein LM583_08460 [Desulfurococcaceae archaeon]|nr:hypothetical protein [Desulfurococcaceae archaeon]
MTLTTDTVRRPATTVWSILDSFLVDLARLQNRICDESLLSKPFYQKLADLVCKGDTRTLDDIDFVKPYYPFILITYYILFHRHNLEVAEAMFKKLKKAYEEHPYTFDLNEKCSLKVLEEVIKDFTVLKKQPLKEYKGRLKTRLRETALKIKSIKCHPRGWGNAFKILVISRLDPEKGIENLREITLMRLNEPPDIDEEVVEGYNLIIHRTPQPVQTFISKTADSLYHELLTAFDRLKSKEIDKKLLEKELGIAKKIMIFQRFMKRYVEDAPTILTILFDMIPLAGGALGAIIYNNFLILIAIIAVIDIIVSIYYVLRKRKLLKISEEIEKFIEENILADVYRTIWSELRV